MDFLHALHGGEEGSQFTRQTVGEVAAYVSQFYEGKAALRKCRAAVERRSLLFARRLLVETTSFGGSLQAVVEAAAAADPDFHQ